jgi:SAM-dependent methyltransferase
VRKASEKDLKKRVQNYWNNQPCGTEFSQRDKGSKQFFEEVENFRYSAELEVFSFAQFTRFHGKRVLEVGIGIGTDFLQWVRAGAKAHGVDLTPEAVKYTSQRLDLYKLKAAGLTVADAEHLPFHDNSFDLVYSWGVIHHSPDPLKGFQEIVRVCRPSGICKVMVCNRQSLCALYVWIKTALLKGRPWKSLSWCISQSVESPETKAFTRREMRLLLESLGVKNPQINSVVTFWDRLGASTRLRQWIGGAMVRLLGGLPVGWFLTVEFTKPQ